MEKTSEKLTQDFLEFRNAYTKLINGVMQTADKIQLLNTHMQENRITNATFEENSRDILKDLERNREEQDSLIAKLKSLRDPYTSQQGDKSNIMQKGSSELWPTGTPAVCTGITTGSNLNQQSQECIPNMPAKKTQSKITEYLADAGQECQPMKTPDDQIMKQNNELPSLELSVANDVAERENVLSGSDREAVNQNGDKSAEAGIQCSDVQQQNYPSGSFGNDAGPKSLYSLIQHGDVQQQNNPSGSFGNDAGPKSLYSLIQHGDVQQQNNPSDPHMDAITAAVGQMNIAESIPKADAPNMPDQKPKDKKVGLFKYFKHKRKADE